jgi:hypothetical protein
MQIIFLILLIGIVLTLLSYSKEGDILTFTGKCPSVKKLQSDYPDKDRIVERLHNLLIYKESYVRWNKYLIIAMFVSMIILFFLRERIVLAEFIILSSFLFLAIDLPNRWANAHIQKGVIQEATQLYTLYSALSN